MEETKSSQKSQQEQSKKESESQKSQKKTSPNITTPSAAGQSEAKPVASGAGSGDISVKKDSIEGEEEGVEMINIVKKSVQNEEATQEKSSLLADTIGN